MTETRLSAAGSMFAHSDFLRVLVIDGRPHWIAHVSSRSAVNLVPLSKWEQAQWKAANVGRRAKRQVRRWWDSVVLRFDREPE